MTPSEAVVAALRGDTPEYTPLAIYDWFVCSDPDIWKPLVKEGLVVIENVQTVRRIEHDVVRTSSERRDEDHVCRVDRIETPHGAVEQLARDGWTVEHWVKTPDDYRVFQWIAENTELEPCYRHLHLTDGIAWLEVPQETMRERFGDNYVTVAIGSRTPAMTINVDYAGLERFCIDLADEVTELFDLYGALEALFVEEAKLLASGPGRFVKWLENFTAEALGPTRYEQLLVPVYEKCVPILEAEGKRVMVHYDGKLAAVADQVAGAPVHIIESLTEPPEGDMDYAQCRAAWPEKAFWAHINLQTYALPEEELRQEVMAKRERAGKRGLAFEVSEDVPPNWKDAFPIVMQTLREMA